MRAIEATGATKTKTALVAKALQYPIREMDGMTVSGKLIIELPLIAKAYGAQYDLSMELLTEAVRLIKQKFNFLAIEEIREAYREWSVGELDIKAEMWGGEFTVAQMAKVLKAYSEKRKKIAAELHKQKKIAIEAAGEQERKEAAQKKFDQEFPQLIEAGKKKYEIWQEVPEFWFKAAYQRGWIKFEQGEADAILKEAEELAALDMAAESKKTRLSRAAYKRTQTPPSSKDSVKDWMNRNPLQEAKVKRIARKITVFRKLIQDNGISNRKN